MLSCGRTHDFAARSKCGVWLGGGVFVLLTALLLSVVLLVALIVAIRASPRRLGLATEDRIAAIFCGSKRTLVCASSS